MGDSESALLGIGVVRTLEAAISKMLDLSFGSREICIKELAGRIAAVQ